jgi:hypothetical protein
VAFWSSLTNKTNAMKNHMIIRVTLLLTLYVFSSAKSFAQIVAAYSFSSSIGTYTPITGGTVITSGTSDDNTFGALNLGFPFDYNGTVYTQFGLNVNGWISMGAAAPASSYNAISTGATNRIIAGMNRDLQLGFTTVGDRTATSNIITNVASTAGFVVGDVLLTATGFPAGTTITAIGASTITVSNNATTTGTAGTLTVGGEIRYETQGVSPNSVCIIQWTRARRFGTAATTGRNQFFNFQIRLSETTNIIDVVYGPIITNPTSSTYEIGLRGNTNADFNNRTTTTDWSATTAGATNAASCTLTTTVFPASGQTYTWTPPAGCSGTPVAGTTGSTANPVCSGANFTLSLSGGSVASGITYQWQSSTDGVMYSNIAGATSASYATSQSVNSYYYCIVTCTSSGLADTSTVLNVTMNSPMNCYCLSNATNAGDEEILNVTVSSLNNTSTCATTGGPGSTLNRYSDYTTIVGAAALTQSSVYSFSVQVGTCGGNFPSGTAIYIDYNQNGLFTDAGEFVYTTPATTNGPHFVTGNFTVPAGALIGNTRMRVINAEGFSGAGITPCLVYGYGETEDYLVNISAAVPCAGTPSPGVTQSTAPSVCGGITFTLSMSTPPSGISGITYQWQSSPDGITYTNIAAGTNATHATSQTSATYYQCIVTCTVSGLADTTTALQVMMNPFMSCYCISNATNTGDEEILNVTVASLNNSSTCATTGGPGSIMGRYSNYTTLVAAPGLAKTATIPFSIQIGTCGGNFTSGTAIFIDYNQNGSFADAGERVYTTPVGTNGPHFVTGSFVVPATALTGNTGMRVINVEGLTGTAITPCLVYGYGETEDYVVNIIPLPPDPPTPVQDPATPTCITGTDLTVPGSPAAGDAWYWQTTATGTSTTNIVSGAYTVFFNGPYYVRTYNAANGIWSSGSDSVIVSNIPLGTTPPAPTAAANPACTSTTISMTAPPAGTSYFWQGTNSTGVSNAENTVVPDTIIASGTYYVSAYDSATTCWSLTNSIAIIIDTYIPAAPATTNDSVVICEGIPSAMVNAASAGADSVIVSFGLNLQSFGPATPFTITVPSIPAGSTITNTQLLITTATAVGGSYRSEMRVALSGATTLAATQLSLLNSAGVITPDPVITVPNLPLAGGSVTLTLSETFDDGGAGVMDATFANIRLIIRYTMPAATINWWDASVAGTLQGSGSPLETVGTTLLPDTNTPGTYTFYASASSASCNSTRTPVTVIVNPLPLMVLTDTAVCYTPFILDAQNAGSTYVWSTADVTQTVSTGTAGMYYVDITTAEGCSARDSMNLIINTPPIVNLGADVAFCTGDSILLDAANTGFNFMWSDSTMNQTITTGTAGNYFVTVTNPLTSCFASDSIIVTVSPLPVINLGIDSSICIGDSLVLDAGNPGATYSWSNSSTNQTLTINSAATYFVFVTDPATSCYNSDTITIGLNTLPVVTVGADTAICNGDVLMLDAGYPGSSYMWNDSSSAQTLNVTTAGNYSVLLTDVNGCKDTDSINVAINALPVVDLGADTTQCAGTITLDAANTGSTFMWSDSTTSQTLTAMSTGTYYVIVTDVNVCSSVDSIDVTINPLPPLNLGNDTIQCGGSLTLDAGNPGFDHLWYDSSTGQTLTVYATNTISVIVTNPVTGCISMDTINITFNQYPLVNLGQDTAQCAGSITLDAGNAGASFMWSTFAATQTISVSSTGTYIVGVTSSGCTTMDTVMVTINSLPLVGFPAVAPICLQGGAINLIATPAGGTFMGGAGVTGGMFDPMLSGLGSHPVLYTVTDVNGCSNSINQMINVADCTGIDEYEGLGNVEVYPNPTSGMFNITLLNANFRELNISITDIQGKEVYSFNDKNIAGDYNKQISLEGLAKGIYYIRLNADAEMKIKKLIIN